MEERGHAPGHDRRRNSGEFRVRPRQSPVNVLILLVVGAMVVTATASVLVEGAGNDGTPHGELLGALREVADRQAGYLRSHGRFAEWPRTLQLTPPDGIQVTIIEGDSAKWEALARHPVGLMCSQTGRVVRGRAVPDEPVCYAPPPRSGVRPAR